jgi:hypothetical protein
MSKNGRSALNEPLVSSIVKQLKLARLPATAAVQGGSLNLADQKILLRSVRNVMVAMKISK